MHEYGNPNDPRRHYSDSQPHRNLPMVIAHSEEVITIYGGEYGIEYLMNPEARMDWDRFSGVYHMVSNERIVVDPNRESRLEEEESSSKTESTALPKWLATAAVDEDLDGGWRYW